jgi:membrane-associated protease RseP (regulator of RpoE activity)
VDSPGRSALLIQEFRKRLQLPTVTTASPKGSTTVAAMKSNPGRTMTPPVLRSTGQWTGIAGIAICSGLVVWIMFSAWALVSSGHAIAEHRLVSPPLAQFPALASTKLFTPQLPDRDVLRLLSPQEDALRRALQNIAVFENARSEEPLRSIPAVVQSVQAASPAALAGLVGGDRITQVNARPADFVWDLYKAITETPQQSIELTVRRDEESFRVLMELIDDTSFDMSNHGMVFGVPDSILYVGQTDVGRLTKQLRTSYVNAQPAELRQAYVDGLLSVTQVIVANLSALAAVPPDGKGYVRSDDLLGWYHTRFLFAAESHRTTLLRLQAHQNQSLYQLGLGLLAAGLATLVAFAAAIKARWVVS